MKEMIICIAPCPGEKQEEKYPGTLNVAEEVIDCCSAGAALAHLHVRDRGGLQTIDTGWFKNDVEKIREQCPIIIEGSTGGAPEHTLEERCVSFTVRGIEMGSLNLGSVNMFDGVYNNSYADIQYYADELKKHGLQPFLNCFDLSHIANAEKLESEELIQPPFVFGFVFDVPHSIQFKSKYLDFFLQEIPAESLWFQVRHHAEGASGFVDAIEKGGHIRIGYEDGPFLSDGTRAGSNIPLVEEVVNEAEKRGRTVVSPERARELMGIKKR